MKKIACILFFAFLAQHFCIAQSRISEKNFQTPPETAKPWVFWYWMQAAVSKEGIHADIQAMKAAGIGGAYLMPIKDTATPPIFYPPVRQLTPAWWEMLRYAMEEAKKAGLKIGMHLSDGFALAGGPWITPELSMQKLVWTKEYITGNGNIQHLQLSQPETKLNYYKDVAVFAYPARSKNAFDRLVLVPSAMSSDGKNVSFLSFRGDSKESYKNDTACWIQYEYPQPFTCRSITIHIGGNNYQAERPTVQASDDGEHFRTVMQLVPPRHGWQDTEEDLTYSIPATTARFFRFVYNKEGSEPGAEDLDAAKWKPSLKVMGIYLSDEPVVDQYESKNGSIWRLSNRTNERQVPKQDCVPLGSIVNLTGKIDSAGELNWKVPAGNWIVVRIGHTSTGQTNATGGAAKGLECDKFNRAAIRLEFNNWFGKVFEKVDSSLVHEVLKVFHVDSWECGSQNWSSNFAAEFKKRRGYDLFPYLLVMTGTPVNDIATTENVLHDVRQTIAELINDIFYVTVKNAAHEKGCTFTAESVAPTMISDGILHYSNADIPMGEFWMNSPTHDKPNDMLDAINGGHLYGKNIIQAEAFTSVRMNWGENPGNLKPVGDRNFALGINRFSLHVFAHNPFIDRKPGVTLDGIGVYFQRDQTWWKLGKAWITYLQRCQSLLQTGKPIIDIAVFTGEEIPRRSLLPDRLVNTLPGIFGAKRIADEKVRLANIGTPLRQKPDGVTNSANMADPEDWIDPLNGYAYDSFNPDALLRLATVKNGRVVLPGGASYALLIFPFHHRLQPDSNIMSLAVAKKIEQLLKQGATILMDKRYYFVPGMKQSNTELAAIMKRIIAYQNKKKGGLIAIPYLDSSFTGFGIEKDLVSNAKPNSIAWTHRRSTDGDIYFLANQLDTKQELTVSLRVDGMQPELWNAVTGEIKNAPQWERSNGRTEVNLKLDANESVFVVLRTRTSSMGTTMDDATATTRRTLTNAWQLRFDTAFGGPLQRVTIDTLKSWTNFTDPAIKYYSGTVIYTSSFQWDGKNKTSPVFLKLDDVWNIAAVKINGQDCGTVWTLPYKLDVTQQLKTGNNAVEIEVANTWANRLIGDNALPATERVTWTTAPFRLKGKPLLKAGLQGSIELEWKQ